MTAGTLDMATYDMAITNDLDANAGVLDLGTGITSVAGNGRFHWGRNPNP